MQIVKIAIIDSGISQYSRGFHSTKRQYCLTEHDGTCKVIEEKIEDFNGHGTVISDIIFQQNPDIQIYSMRIVSNEQTAQDNLMQTDIECEHLCTILEYILENLDVDIINISAGITYIDDWHRIGNVCNALKQKGILIVAAFDNFGSISYPAALSSVLGVDVVENGLQKKDIAWIHNSCVNFLVPAKFYRTFWNDGTKTIMKGTSFACAEITGKISTQLFDEQGNRNSIDVVVSKLKTCGSIYQKTKPVTGPQFTIKKAILFPVNKEAHAVLRFQDMLDFELSGVYDERVTGLVGTEVFGRKIESYGNIDWDADFDTVILSCISRLASLTKKDYVKEIVEQARVHNKNIYTFEKIDSDYENIFYPELTSEHVPVGNMGKLRKMMMPLVGVFGTSSQQGKYTLQLTLKKKLDEKGYRTGLLATEPSGYLFGADSVFHFGYESGMKLSQREYIMLLNEMVWNMDKKGCDIGITGCQSGTLSYDYSNIRTILLEQQNFLLGTRPDFYILCINPHDDIAYVQRTIQYINVLDEGKVFACALYPVKTVFTETGVQMKKISLEENEIKECKQFFEEHCGVPVYSMGNEQDLEKLSKLIIQTFNGEVEEC